MKNQRYQIAKLLIHLKLKALNGSAPLNLVKTSTGQKDTQRNWNQRPYNANLHLVNNANLHLVNNANLHLVNNANLHLVNNANLHLVNNANLHLVNNANLHLVNNANLHLINRNLALKNNNNNNNFFKSNRNCNFSTCVPFAQPEQSNQPPVKTQVSSHHYQTLSPSTCWDTPSNP